MQLRYLSFIIKEKNPGYGKKWSVVKFKKIRSIKQNDPCNEYRLTFNNHLGTHVDCPAHFFQDSLGVCDYPAVTWFFYTPYVLKIKVKEDYLITAEDIVKIPDNADLLLIQTGFSAYRETEKYNYHNPGFLPEVGLCLRKNYPSLRAIGFDFVSLSSYQNRDIGREAHRAFLNPQGLNHPILIIEDMDLSGDLSKLNSVCIIPILIEEIDSSPCVAIGNFL